MKNLDLFMVCYKDSNNENLILGFFSDFEKADDVAKEYYKKNIETYYNNDDSDNITSEGRYEIVKTNENGNLEFDCVYTVVKINTEIDKVFEIEVI